MTTFPRAEVRDAARRAVRQAARQRCEQWVAFRIEVPWRRVRALCEQPASERFFWERPNEERTIAAFGVAHAIECEGRERFARSAARARSLFACVHVAGVPAPDAAGPLLVGGFGFADTPGDDAPLAKRAAGRDCPDHESTAGGVAAPLWSGFPAARLVLPELTVSRSGDRAWCTAVCHVPFPYPYSYAESEGMRTSAAAGEAGASVEAADPVYAICDTLCARLEAALATGDDETARSVRSEADAADHRIVSEHPHAHYRSRVAAALREIRAGELLKVVVARSVRVCHEPGFDAARVTAALRDTYPSCTTFAVSRPGATFLGATPERLVRVEGGRVETAALAGSAPRGRSPEEDARLGRELSLSKKEQGEHAVVVRALCDALAPCCSELDVAEAPRLLRVEGIQHLETPLAGSLKGDHSAVELAGRLHPAPSVGGAPRSAALAWLEREEGLERGWYAAPLGWMDASGAGEFCVALRSALLRDGEATLFAGAGVVEGSDPESELRETRLKLRALLGPLLEI